jgi:hypothetical protein
MIAATSSAAGIQYRINGGEWVNVDPASIVSLGNNTYQFGTELYQAGDVVEWRYADWQPGAKLQYCQNGGNVPSIGPIIAEE